MAGVRIGVGGVVEFELSPPVEFILAQTGAFQEELLNFERLWERFVPLMSQFEQQRFDTEGFGEWPQLAESTVQWKDAHGYGDLGILVRTGALRDSLVDPEQAATVEPASLVWGTDVDYAQWHQDGTDRMPQRKVLDISIDQRRDLEIATVNYVNEAARVAFERTG